MGQRELSHLGEAADLRAGDRVVLMEDELERAGEGVRNGGERDQAHEILARCHGESIRCVAIRRASKPIAIKIAMPPAVMTPVRKVMFEPAMIWEPSPPPPAKTARVARATVDTVAIRRPATISGTASGSST